MRNSFFVLLAVLFVTVLAFSACGDDDDDDDGADNPVPEFCDETAMCSDEWETEAECIDYITTDCGSNPAFYECLRQCLDSETDCEALVACELWECSGEC